LTTARENSNLHVKAQRCPGRCIAGTTITLAGVKKPFAEGKEMRTKEEIKKKN